MDIGTAKPSHAELQQVPHHLIDVVDPDQSYSLATYQEQALAAIDRIVRRDRVPLLVGGAGLYVSAVCEGLALPDVPPDPVYRESLEQRAAADGWQSLQLELARVDPVSATRIDPKNVRRVIRALEVFRATGQPFSRWQTPLPAPPVEAVIVGLRLERAALKSRLDRRVDAWIGAGFVDEVQGLLARGFGPELPSMSSIGYREIARYLAGQMPLETAVELTKQATNQYAKRQMTWFRHRPGIHWIDASAVECPRALVAEVLDRFAASGSDV
jgi:tRNA dimethylallyltransferase